MCQTTFAMNTYQINNEFTHYKLYTSETVLVNGP